MGISVLIGIIMYFLRKEKYPNVSFILGVILGPLMEEYLRTSLTLSHGSVLVFFTNIDSVVFLVITVLFCVLLPRANRKSEKLEAEAEEKMEEEMTKGEEK